MPRLDDSLRVLAHAFPRWDLTPDAIRTWAVLLSGDDVESLHAAAVELARTSKFPPTIAEWRERAAAIQGMGKALATTAGEAWDETYRNRHARYRGTVAWSSDAVLRAARIVRWDDPDWTSEQIPTIRAQFERHYLALRDKAATVEAARDGLEFAREVEALISGPTLPRIGGPS